MTEPRGRQPVWDGMRGAAILAVVAYHAWTVSTTAATGWVPGVPYILNVVLSQGAQGVGLFYLVSAVTITQSWKARASQDPHPLAAFWARRWWRIAPLFYLSLAIYAIATPGDRSTWPGVGSPWTAGNVLAHVTFIFGWVPRWQNSLLGVEWSIGVEMAAYALFPLWHRVVQHVARWQAVAVAGLLGVGWVVGCLLAGPWPPWSEGYWIWAFPFQAIWFAVGWSLQSSRPPRARRGVLVLVMGLTLGVALVPWAYRWGQLVQDWVWVVPASFLVWLAQHQQAPRWLEHRILRYIGTRSYGWYLWHWGILVFVWGPLVRAWALSDGAALAVRLTGTLAMTALVSEMTYRCVERPGIALGRRWLIRHGWAADRPRVPAIPKEGRL